MKATVRQFVEKAQQDGELKEKFQDISKQFKDAPHNEETKEKVISAIIAIAKGNGFNLSPDDFRMEEGEILDSELVSVAGGGGCFCIGAGGGGGTDENDGNTYGCACVGYGQGGDGSADDFSCMCPITGSGGDHR